MGELTTETLRVRGDTDPGKLGKSILSNLEERHGLPVNVRAMGVRAVGQAVKGMVFAGKLLEEANPGADLWCRPRTEETDDGLSVTVFEVSFG